MYIVAACVPGEYLEKSNNTCLSCPAGQYQPEKWQESCISCGDPAQWRTDGVGKDGVDDCMCKLILIILLNRSHGNNLRFVVLCPRFVGHRVLPCVYM